jgi:tetratricopeptide (TPR) repeat protein
VHPLQTESVTYIVQRAESLCGLFYLLTLYCVIRGSTSGTNPPSAFRRPPSAFRWYSAAFLACLLGMATKEVMVTAPLVVLLYDRTFLAGSFGQALRRRWGLYLGLAVTLALLAYLVFTTGLLGRRTELESPNWLEYACSQPRAIITYLRLCIWPNPLCTQYRWPDAQTRFGLLSRVLAVAAILTATIWGLTQRKQTAILGGIFFLILAPTTSILPLYDFAAEHRTYLPLAAVVAGLVGGVNLASQTLARRVERWPLPTIVIVNSITITVCVAFGILTSRRNVDYHSELAIWEKASTVFPTNEHAITGIGRVLAKQGRLSEAIAQFQKALELRPDAVGANSSLVAAFADLGRFDDAIESAREAAEFNPNCAELETNLGNALSRSGRIAEGIAHYRKALEIKPDYPDAEFNLGTELSKRGSLAEAIVHYRKALEWNPIRADVYVNLGNVFARQGQLAEATAARNNLGNVLWFAGRYDEAITEYAESLRNEPENAAVRVNLANALYQEGRLAEAVAQWREVIGLRPRDVAVLNMAAWTLATATNASVRDGQHAVEMAEQAASISNARDPAVLDTLAAAYAEIGRFSDAVKTAQRALALANGQRNPALAEKIAARVKLYQASKNYRDAR